MAERIRTMSIKCLLGHHKWKFSYNHNIPLGTNLSIDEVLAMLKSGKAYAVDACTKCGAQSRMVNSKRIMLSHSEVEGT